ncbi:pectinesterase/pectinesterase inhibitor 45 [Carex littledalei]|uniref:Pectinesterase n=1 Tax=Carex littledalei TaxID=544730 RepID=A0A833VM11_9POAL|nr:pectinesterase/pectinesterase inhibitor 45 [Carex littledalei]
MKKKAVAGILASLLVIIVCAGAIIALVHSTKKARSDIPTSIHTSKFMRSRNLCSTALHKESCELMLSNVSPKPKSSGDSRFEASLAQSPSTHTEIFKSFIVFTLKELEIAAKRAADIGSGKGRTGAALNDCQKLLTDALKYAEDAVDLVGDRDLESLTAEADNIVHMLTASMTYMYTCVDGFENSKLNSEMNSILNNATVTSSNALGVINSISSSAVKSKSHQGTSRKLLGYDLDRHGYPTWLSTGERKLLQAASSQPNVVVALDGSGDYKTINDAIKNIPASYTKYVIYVKAGVYEEMVMIPRDKPNLTIYGDGMDKTIVTGSISDRGSATKLQSVFAIDGQNFIAKDMGFRNTAGAIGYPAVTVRTSAEYISFYNCKIDGYQDTLYAHTGRQFFRDCTISGTIDFIFGNSAVVFQNCKIVVNTPQPGAQNVITANGRTDPNMKTGFVLHNCEIMADKDFEANRLNTANYLGRPWKEYARTMIIESTIGDLIHQDGWMSWKNTNFGLNTLTYGEYGNKGSGAAIAKRVTWPGYHVLSKSDAEQYCVGSFINDNKWLDSTGIPSTAGLMT